MGSDKQKVVDAKGLIRYLCVNPRAYQPNIWLSTEEIEKAHIFVGRIFTRLFFIFEIVNIDREAKTAICQGFAPFLNLEANKKMLLKVFKLADIFN